ncbi:hypothetical protein DFH08DRAFT_902335 [Mycena albidolilacea]|uniref:Fatty acid hydroxylase domain-containing protein n=1 Tax=Mycena albidolilacea TaxID=1033008 RepID=A0AAD6Z366_9AGAR|nr:hypothetical protein DFH08DRAFT_902335 [Mycena albidolilacea]
MASTTRNRKPLVSNASGTHSSGSDSDASGVSQFDPLRELWFRVRQIPSKITRSIGPVALCCPLGFWAAFISRSTDYTKRFTETGFAHKLRLDSPALNRYSLWRGVVVISVSTSFTYISIALLALRHELFHWKPEMLEKYLRDAKASFLGRLVPESWLNYLFNIYESGHAKRTRDRIQGRDHRAAGDHHELAQVVRCVLRNLFVSTLVVVVIFVPPVQILPWHLIGDTFYFFPHYIAHTPRRSKGIHHKVLPAFLADRLGSFLRNAHKTHHRSKANLAIAAWYCSVTEQVLFNLFPTMLGPVVTQLIADKTGYAKTWGTHLITLYVWLLAGTATSVLAHTGFRTSWNDPGKHDEHHEYAFGTHAVNFGSEGK